MFSTREAEMRMAAVTMCQLRKIRARRKDVGLQAVQDQISHTGKMLEGLKKRMENMNRKEKFKARPQLEEYEAEIQEKQEQIKRIQAMEDERIAAETWKPEDPNDSEEECPYPWPPPLTFFETIALLSQRPWKQHLPRVMRFKLTILLQKLEQAVENAEDAGAVTTPEEERAGNCEMRLKKGIEYKEQKEAELEQLEEDRFEQIERFTRKKGYIDAKEFADS